MESSRSIEREENEVAKAARKASTTLAEFEGLPVAAVGVEMPNAAGGLQDAMKLDPVEWHGGDEGYIVLHYTVNKIRFEPIVRGAVEPLRRVHVLHVDEAAPIDGELVAQHLTDQRERIQKAKEDAEGVQRLPMEDGESGDGVSMRHRNDDIEEGEA